MPKPLAHARHAAPAHTYAPDHAAPAPAPATDFAALLDKPAGASLFSDLLSKAAGSGKRRRLVICSMCGEQDCEYSRYVDD
jgi:hypothetical protein